MYGTTPGQQNIGDYSGGGPVGVSVISGQAPQNQYDQQQYVASNDLSVGVAGNAGATG